MYTITLSDHDLPTLKSILKKEITILEKRLKSFNKEIDAYEKKYGMSSSKFMEKYNKGYLDDSKDFVDWNIDLLAVYDIKQRLKSIKELYVQCK